MELLAEPEVLWNEPEVDFTTGEMGLRMGIYLIPKEFALEVLQDKSLEAAQWFRDHFPTQMEHLTFGFDEVEVIGKITIYDDLDN